MASGTARRSSTVAGYRLAGQIANVTNLSARRCMQATRGDRKVDGGSIGTAQAQRAVNKMTAAGRRQLGLARENFLLQWFNQHTIDEARVDASFPNIAENLGNFEQPAIDGAGDLSRRGSCTRVLQLCRNLFVQFNANGGVPAAANQRCGPQLDNVVGAKRGCRERRRNGKPT